MSYVTTREVINDLVTTSDVAELSRVEDELLTRLDSLALRLGTLQQKIKDPCLKATELLDLMEARQVVEEDLHVAQESLAYLRFRRNQEKERYLREAMKDLNTVGEPSIHRRDMISFMFASEDTSGMKHLLNALMEQRTKIIANKDVLERALQRVSIENFAFAEMVVANAEDMLGAIDNDITLLWQELNKGI